MFTPAFVEISAPGMRSSTVVIDGVEYRTKGGHAKRILVKLTTTLNNLRIGGRQRVNLPLALRFVSRVEIVNARDGAEVIVTGILINQPLEQVKQGDYTSVNNLVDSTVGGL
jgi:hypothetical protein